MGLNISQKGDYYFVEDDGSNRVVGTFKSKEAAVNFAKEKTNERNDYFKKTKVNVVINSDEMSI